MNASGAGSRVQLAGGWDVVDADPSVDTKSYLILGSERDAAVTDLFMAHHKRLIGLARLLVDDLATAEDIVQDAFMSLYRRWPWLRDRGSALAYLQASVANGARSNLRRRRVARGHQLGEADVVPSAETSVLRGENHREVLSGLAALPLRQRQVLVLRFYLDQSEAEIAETLGVSRGSVKKHASRAIAALTVHMGVAR